MFSALLGGAFGGLGGQAATNYYPGQIMYMNQVPAPFPYQHQLVCIHPGCVICKEEHEKLQKIREEKQTAYKNRCVEWMKKVGRKL